MEIREFDQVSDHVTLIYDRVFPLYIIHGDKNYLIDCAITAKAREIAGKIKELLSNKEDLVSFKINALLLTHTHYDHIGSCSFLQDIYNFDIYSSQVGVNLLKKQKVVDFVNHLNAEFNKKLGVQSDLLFKKPENLIILAEGNKIKIDKTHELEVLETPGHTRCSLAYYLLPDKIMFPGDSIGVMEKDGAVKPLFLSSYKSYIESIKKLQTYDIKILCFAHNRYLKGKEKVEIFLKEAIKSAQTLKDEILEKYSFKQDYPVAELAEDILKDNFPLPTVMGPKEALMINVTAMIKVILREFL